MFRNNIKLAMESLSRSKWRSFLTMLGVIIGVVSVVTVVSIGEGVKQKVSSQIKLSGPDLITIRPGQVVNRDAEGRVTGYNPLGILGTGSLTEADLKGIQEVKDVALAVPMNHVTGTVTVNKDTTYSQAFVVGSTPDAESVLTEDLMYGDFYGTGDENATVIGQRVAKQLFGDSIPLGRSFEFRGESFVIYGIFEEFETSPLTPSVDYNNSIFIPYQTSKRLADGQVNLYQIQVKASNQESVDQVADTIRADLRASRGGQEDFTVLKPTENLTLANSILSLLTTMIAAVAAVSLVVGGIGIMNVMLVSVAERTHEIGVRKAVGATNGQILTQFMFEAGVLSFIGGILGVLASLLANYLLRITTELGPVINWPIVLVATYVSLAVGIIFGIAPAIRASRMDPIDALRNEY